MHEMSLAEGILTLVEATARREQARRVKRVTLEIGALASVDIGALRFCFDAVTRASLAEHAALDIITLAGRGWCLPCGLEVPLSALADACPHCGSFQVQPVSGMEMRVKEIDIE
ncbi:putative hydrogenase nickel incorporation protein HypA [Betaproteobacteria bacterium]|nr:putative hydrogenase nickel incorporation protein HypA [Betaproteobacteria bacterium]GHU15220.1 putative hydrogenase nickel incorporation protein HypA [Betaproteobacteria bacterium]GHU46894.1 putative hydrogenase nickel incorporation protein HypA [Betaproteobacteria bacterium]